MSTRAGPVRGSRRQVRQTPYSRPVRSAPAPRITDAETRPSLFTRLKRFFWGAPAPKSEEVPSEPPILLGRGESGYLMEPVLRPDMDYSQYADVDSETSMGSRITHSFPDLLPQSPQPEGPVVSNGPNEALQQFFETKGDEELSNMEVVGVLSLIGQAVSRNESLVDFSQLSMDARSDLEATTEATNGETSVLRGLHVPPSPRLHRGGTPPSTARTFVDRSPFNSTPRRSSIRARHSLAAAPPLRSPATLPRAPRPSGLRNSLAPGDTMPTMRANQRVTPAASAILHALDSSSSSSPNVSTSHATHARDGTTARGARLSTARLSTAAQEPKKSLHTLPSVAQTSSEGPANAPHISPRPIPGSLMGPSSVTKPKSSSEDGFPSLRLEKVNSSSAKRPETTQVPPTDIPAAVSSVPHEEHECQGETFSFEIPPSTAPREMTPAEEAIVAETQTEFTF